jgi:hypothetical protein
MCKEMKKSGGLQRNLIEGWGFEMLVDLDMEIAPSRPPDEAIGAAYCAERRFWKSANEESIRED